MRRRPVLIVALIVVGVAVAGVLLSRSPLLARRASAFELAPSQLRQTIVVSGRVLSPARVDIGAVQTGRVAAVLVEEGERVVANRALVRLDVAELGASLAQARAAEAAAEARVGQWREVGQPSAAQALRQAQANLRVAEKDLGRQRELLARGFVGQARVDEAERALAVARAQVEIARAQARAVDDGGSEAREARSRLDEARAARALAEARVGNATIRSPADGTIVSRTVEPGDVVQPGKRLLSLAVAGETRVACQVDEKNLALVRVGQGATASADAFPGTRFGAVVISLAPAVDPQKGTVEAKLRVLDPPAFLRADMTVSVEIEVARKAGALVVPLAAVRSRSDDVGIVLVERDGRAQAASVRLGPAASGRAEIVEGLAAGDRVILDADVAAGDRLRVSLVANAAALATAAGRGEVSGQGAPMGQLWQQ